MLKPSNAERSCDPSDRTAINVSQRVDCETNPEANEIRACVVSQFSLTIEAWKTPSKWYQ